MIAFTILGVLVFWGWCFSAGWWLGMALDVLLPLWMFKKLDATLAGLIADFSIRPERAGYGSRWVRL